VTHERKTIFADWSGTESSLVLMPMDTGPLLLDLELVESLGAARVMPPGPEEIVKGKWRGYQVRYAGVLVPGLDVEGALGAIRFSDGWLQLRQILVGHRTHGFIVDARWSPAGGLRIAAHGLETLGNGDDKALAQALRFTRRVVTTAELASRARAGRSSKSGVNRTEARRLTLWVTARRPSCA